MPTSTLRRSAILDLGLELEADEVRQVRLGQRLRAVVAHAYQHAPRVRRTLDAAGVSPGDVRGLEDLGKLPVTRKDALPAMQAEGLSDPSVIQKIPPRTRSVRARRVLSGAATPPS